MMLRPNDFWVANARTIWAYLLIKHADNYEHANEELKLYRDGERDSEMSYEVWSGMHRMLETSQVRLHDLGLIESERQGVPVGLMRYLWSDAIASELYASNATRPRR
jgi:hypothetical protein